MPTRNKCLIDPQEGLEAALWAVGEALDGCVKHIFLADFVAVGLWCGSLLLERRDRCGMQGNLYNLDYFNFG